MISPANSAHGASSVHDLFICHASEDKKQVARPLAEALSERGLKVWLDELELTIGDSLSGQIEAALAQCRFGVVVLSPAFFAKRWPQRELAGLAAREIDVGSKVILPVWHHVDHHYIAQRSPILADRLGAQITDGIPKVAEEIARALERSSLNSLPEYPGEPAAVRGAAKDQTGHDDSPHRRLLGVAVLSLLPPALAGFAIARGAQGETSMPLTGNASNRSIEVSFPAGWRRSSTPPAMSGVKLGEPLALVSPSSTGTLVLGTANTTSTTLLPASLLLALPRLPRAEVVRLDGRTFYRYRGIVPRGAASAETVYVQPTTRGVVLGLCAPRSLTGVVSADCERILGSLKLASARPLSPSTSSAYAAALTSVVSELNRIKAEITLQMTHATAPASQAGAAERMAAGYIQAGESLARAIPGPPEQALSSAIVGSLRRIAQGYTTMASAIHQQNASKFNRGRGVVASQAGTLASTFAQLSRLGYRFRG